MQLRIKVTEDRLTVGDLVALESGRITATRDVFAKLATNDAGEYLPEAEARALVDTMTIPQLQEQSRVLATAIKASIPPVSGGD